MAREGPSEPAVAESPADAFNMQQAETVIAELLQEKQGTIDLLKAYQEELEAQVARQHVEIEGLRAQLAAWSAERDAVELKVAASPSRLLLPTYPPVHLPTVLPCTCVCLTCTLLDLINVVNAVSGGQVRGGEPKSHPATGKATRGRNPVERPAFRAAHPPQSPRAPAHTFSSLCHFFAEAAGGASSAWAVSGRAPTAVLRLQAHCAACNIAATTAHA